MFRGINPTHLCGAHQMLRAPSDERSRSLRAPSGCLMSPNRGARLRAQFGVILSAVFVLTLGVTLGAGPRSVNAQVANGLRVASPFEYSPLLDVAPETPRRERTIEWTEGASGFRVGSYLGVSFGSAASYLSPRISSLDLGTFPLCGLYLGYRLGSTHAEGWVKRFELGINSALGFGRTFELNNYDDALDVHIRPMVTYHFAEGESWVTSLGVGLNIIVFDLEDEEVSQIGIGPAFAPRLTWKMGDLSQVFFEFQWSPLYDFLAYSFREPTEDELMDNPEILEIKENGKWFNHYLGIVGLRLLGF